MFNKELAEALITLQNSKESEIPPFAEGTIEEVKAGLKKLNEEIKLLTA